MLQTLIKGQLTPQQRKCWDSRVCFGEVHDCLGSSWTWQPLDWEQRQQIPSIGAVWPFLWPLHALTKLLCFLSILPQHAKNMFFYLSKKISLLLILSPPPHLDWTSFVLRRRGAQCNTWSYLMVSKLLLWNIYLLATAWFTSPGNNKCNYFEINIIWGQIALTTPFAWEELNMNGNQLSVSHHVHSVNFHNWWQIWLFWKIL